MATQYGAHETRRSIAGRTLTVLLVSIAMIAGCSVSWRASSAPPEPPASPASPYDQVARDAATISADVRQAVDKLIKDANQIAAKRDGKVYVNKKEFGRVLVFVPAPAADSDEELPGIMRSQTSTPPKNAVFEKWTDRFALAQELTHRYSYVETLAIERHLNPPYFTARVKLLIKSTQRWAYAGKAKDIPETPAGFVVWARGTRSDFGGLWQIGGLPAPQLPSGRIVTRSLKIDAISRSALDSLRNRPPKKSKHTVIAQMAYDHLKSRWCLSDAERGDGFPEPKRLYWNRGLKGDRAFYVLRPSDIRRREPSSKPTSKE